MRATTFKLIRSRVPLPLLAALLAAALTSVHAASGAEGMTIKLATVAPNGSIYHRVLQETGAAWRAAQGEGSRFIVYADGTQGSEANSVRRMRIGQLDAAMLSVTGLQEIDDSVMALQVMPLVFRSWQEFDFVHEGLRGELEQRFRDKGFVVLFWGEGGWVQFFATEPRIVPDDFRNARIFAYAGNPEQVGLMKSMGYHPVVLELSDVLSSLQTGMIDVVPVAPMWSLAFQVYRNTPHMVRMNWVPIVGATVITVRTWERMSEAARTALTEAARTAGQTLRAHRDEQDERTIEAMQSHGLTVHELSAEARSRWQVLAESVWPRIRGAMVPAATFDHVMALLESYRSQVK